MSNRDRKAQFGKQCGWTTRAKINAAIRLDRAKTYWEYGFKDYVAKVWPETLEYLKGGMNHVAGV